MAGRYAQLHGSDLIALVLSAPALGISPAFEMLLEMDPMPEVPIDPSQLSRDPSVGLAYDADPLVWHGPFLRPTIEALLAAIRELASGPSFASLPTLWIHGDGDELVPLELTRPSLERIRGEQFESIVYAGARHEVFNETNHDEVLAALISFLDRVLSAPGAAAQHGLNPRTT